MSCANVDEVKIRDWRHQLQKAFLSCRTLPNAEVLQEMDQIFTVLEDYNEMTFEQLRSSKIGKVMRHVAALTTDKAPRDDEYKFRTRAKNLCNRWKLILDIADLTQRMKNSDLNSDSD